MFCRRYRQAVIVTQQLHRLWTAPTVYKWSSCVPRHVTLVRDTQNTFCWRSFASEIEPVKVPEITYDVIEKHLNDRNVVIVDVRTPKELNELGMIPGAKNLPVEELEAALTMNETDFKSKYGFVKPSPSDKKIVFYCRSGKRASNACRSFMQQNYSNVFTYIGSWNEWSEKHPEHAKKRSE